MGRKRGISVKSSVVDLLVEFSRSKTDDDIAKLHGNVTRQYVGALRRAHGLPKRDAIANWHKPAKLLFGTASDAAIARVCGAHPEAVRRLRVSLGIASFDRKSGCGTFAQYNRKCRCKLCVAANTEYRRKRKEARRDRDFRMAALESSCRVVESTDLQVDQ